MRSTACMMTFLAILAATIAPADAGKPTAGSIDDQSISELLATVRKKHDLPGMAAAVVSNKGIVAAGVAGVRKRDEDARLGPDDIFHLGSDSKPLTAWLIAWLIENGKLGWDTTLAEAFPKLADQMSDEVKKVTVSQLLCHRSGLPANVPGSWWTFHSDKKTPREQRLALVEKIAKNKLDANPDEKLHYSNIGYVVLGAIAENVADASWEDLLRKHLFEPLKLKHAGFGPAGKADAIEQPWPHNEKGKPIAPTLLADNPPIMGPAGRVHMSLPDWAAVVAEIMRGMRGEKALLKAETYQKLATMPYKGDFYCLGGWGGSAKAPRVKLQLMHDGSNTLNYCTAYVVPEDNYAILAVANQGGDAALKACHEVRDDLKSRMKPKKK